MRVQEAERQTLEARLHRQANVQYKSRRRELDDIASVYEEVDDVAHQSTAVFEAIWQANHRFYK